MAQVGQWADHNDFAARLERAADSTVGEPVVYEAVAALRDLGDRLDVLTADNAKLERACKAIGRAAFEECL